MNQSRTVWLVGGAAGLLVTLAALGVRVATSEYRLRIRVTDVHGPLSGVWVALGEKDVRSTDSAGFVEIQGRRFELDDAVLTVSDPSLTQLHFSQTLRTSISWLPWVAQSELVVTLPLVGGSPLSSADGSDSSARAGLDLPPFSEGVSENSEATQGRVDLPLGVPLREDVLLGSEDSPHTSEQSQAVDVVKAFNFAETERKLCEFTGLSESFCQAMLPAISVPLQGQNWYFAEAPHSSSSVPAAENNAARSLKQTSLLDTRTESSTTLSPVVKNSVVRIEVTQDGRPLVGASVYMSRARDNRVRELGKTSAAGSIDSRISREFFGETITVFHECCAPKSFSAKFNKQKDLESLKVDLTSGVGYGVLVLQDAYGLTRKVEQAQLLSNTGKLAVSGTDGFALYDASKTPGIAPSKVTVRAAKPAEFRLSENSVRESGRSAPLSFLVMPEQTYLPSIAVVERSGGQTFQGVLKNSNIRRWRREFMTRLMRLTSVRTVVSTEAEARIASAGESLPDVISRGWSETHLAGEWDFLLSVHYDETTGKILLSAIDAQGKEFFENRSILSETSDVLPAESVARKTFDSFLKSIPFEGAVLEQRGDNVQLSFQKADMYGLASGTPLAIYQQSPVDSGELRLADLAALAVVSEASKDGHVSARITHWNLAHRKTEILPDVVRVVKVSAEDYQKEARRKGMKSLQTSQNNSRRNSPL